MTHDLPSLLNRRIQRVNQYYKFISNRLSRISFYRIFFFILLIGSILSLYGFLVPFVYSFPIVLGIGILFYLQVYRYHSWDNYSKQLHAVKFFLERELLRLSKESKKLYYPPLLKEEELAKHPYAMDLNIFDKDGLYSLWDTTSTKAGHFLFLENLLQLKKESYNDIIKRQELVQELTKNKWFSYKFLRIASYPLYLNSAHKWSLESWKKSIPTLLHNRPFVRIVYPYYSIVSGLGIALSLFFGYPFGVSFFLLNTIFFLLYRNPSRKIFKHYERAYENIQTLKKLLLWIERISTNNQQTNSPQKKKNQLTIKKSIDSFSKSYTNIWKVPAVHFLLNSLFLYDLWKQDRLRKWQQVFEVDFSNYIHKLEFLDSLHPLVHLKFLYPNYNFPRILNPNQPCTIQGKNLRHPLLLESKVVGNPIPEWKDGKILFITGSNMSGKTTYLRTIGTNILLGLMGGPCACDSLEFPPLQISCSIRNQDSLREGFSFFYAEVHRLKSIFQTIEKSEGYHLILLDEILKGTNTRERYIASIKILERLKKPNLYTICTSHDLELAKIPDLLLYHFTEKMEGDTMGFDYTLKEGLVQSSNALYLLHKEGVILNLENGNPMVNH